MRRSLGVVVVGWVSGFLIAVAWGATRANNPRLASALSGWAIAGMVVTAILLISIAVSDRGARRRAADSMRLEAENAANVATVMEERSAARVARLEARLAREKEELDAAVAALAATGQVGAGTVDPVPDVSAAKLEPALRQEVVNTVAELVGRAEPGQSAELAGALEALLQKTR